ncbi:putative ribonuclease pmrp protein subunit pop5 [Nicotiana attenuata]|uniref:Ribonuclease pmrp protein subunit pop5 n=1 Tax=Nicotiana attenuata TaxID=49451 RepID=A0A314KPM2_NICAT|nr:putative ribonuclease pmrp protein subunit pop5 [Nicotiana attenuata]
MVMEVFLDPNKDTGVDEPIIITQFNLTKAIKDVILTNFGECALASSTNSFQVKYVNPITKLCIIRASREEYQRVWAAITMVRSVGSCPVVFNLLDLSGSIRACRAAALKCDELKFQQYQSLAGARLTPEEKQGADNQLIGGGIPPPDSTITATGSAPSPPCRCCLSGGPCLFHHQITVKRIMVGFKNRYMVMEVFLDPNKDTGADEPIIITPFNLTKAIKHVILTNFVKYVNTIIKLCIIRASREKYQRVWAAITMVWSLGSCPVVFKLVDLSGSIRACRAAALKCDELKFQQPELALL